MRIGAFELAEPVPELNEAHALTIIPYWMDAGMSASLTLSHLERHLGGEKLASFGKPGEFFDFTRYRPTLSRKEEASEVAITNAIVTYGRQKEGCDFIFLRLPEPHAMAEVYVDSVVELLTTLGVKRYCLLGSIYDMVPYTRPLLVTGSASNHGLKNNLSVTKVVASDYEGPTTILSLIEQRMFQMGIETLNLIVHLPGYLTPDEDYRGEKRLMEVIGSLYDLPVPQEAIDKAKEQDERFSQISEQFLEQQPQLRVMLKQLEESYDARVKSQKKEVHLSPEVEKFLKELNGRFDKG